MRPTPIALPALLLALGLAACADGTPSDAAPVDLDTADVVVVTEDMAFVDPPTQLDAGDLSIGLDNRGDARHDVTIEDVGTVADARGGGQDLGDVTLEPGTYTVYCSLPGHRQAGMEYEVTVQ